MHDDVVYKDKFVWNRQKNKINKQQHSISFEAAALVFDDPLAMVVYDLENSGYNEDRYRITGFMQLHPSFVTVSFTLRMDITRIFSARKADDEEKEEYCENARRNII
jgi:uncharacterized DUF497 family protein